MAGSERRLLQSPPHAWISWLVMAAYVAIFVQSVILYLGDAVNGVWTRQVYGVVHQMWGIYAFEVVLAVGPGWCCMSGWAALDVIIHHVPYIAATALAEGMKHTAPWIDAFAISTLTALNEGLLVAISLGVPDGVAKIRRLYGFSIISLLAFYELKSWFFQMLYHWHTGVNDKFDLLCLLVVDQIVLAGLAYHISLVQLYIRGWRKRRFPKRCCSGKRNAVFGPQL
mmetsp:Transcript_77401/g.146013  ORF Transcript_77401/g.146013 Transcript_77401/m.146013 type:complete len:226 (+) Transcript_77401:108-785(+)